MRLSPSRLLLPVLAVAVLGAVAATPVTASALTRSDRPDPGPLPRPAADSPQTRGADAPIGGVVPGATGAAARHMAGAAADRFRQVTRDRLASEAQAAAGGTDAGGTDAGGTDAGTLAAQLHSSWGVNLPHAKGQGLHITQSVVTGTSPLRGGDYVYAPTAIPPGNACMEMTTAYTPSGPQLWAWDWCNGRDGVGKSVKIDSKFLSTYTTTVNGNPSYSLDEHQTAASTNTWTSYLYNYSTHAWDTFYTSSGKFDLTSYSYGWNIFEIYTSVESATGTGYYCRDLAGKVFESSDAQVYANGAWTPVTTANSSAQAIRSGQSFDCPALKFSLVHPNDHWRVQIGGGTQ